MTERMSSLTAEFRRDELHTIAERRLRGSPPIVLKIALRPLKLTRGRRDLHVNRLELPVAG
jgi:hypothetical protein